jgi:hypothetical protein
MSQLVDLPKEPRSLRSLTSLNLAGNPIAEPLTYPGAIPAESGLLIQQTYLALEATPGRRLPQYRVHTHGTPVPGHPTEAESLNLDDMLLRYNSTQSDLRVPVLAIGSNAAPGQIRAKFGSYLSPLILPMTFACEVHGLVPGVSAHVSRPGYLPATLVRQAGEVSQLFVLWPDVEQLRVLDATEPNYHRMLVDGAKWPIILESGEHLSLCYAYLSRHGHLVDSAGRALRLPDHRPRVDSGLPAKDLEPRPAFFRDQSMLINWLIAGDTGISAAAGETAEDFVRSTRSNELKREQIRAALIESGLVGHDSVLEGLAQGVVAKGSQPLCYEDIRPIQIQARRPRHSVDHPGHSARSGGHGGGQPHAGLPHAEAAPAKATATPPTVRCADWDQHS